MLGLQHGLLVHVVEDVERHKGDVLPLQPVPPLALRHDVAVDVEPLKACHVEGGQDAEVGVERQLGGFWGCFVTYLMILGDFG